MNNNITEVSQKSAAEQAVPAGYKQTEVLPEDWIECQLDEAITLQRGFDLPHRMRKSGSIPIVSSAGISGRHNLAIVTAPGIVTGRYGTIGEIFYIDEPFWPLNTTLYVKHFKNIIPKYAFYLLKTVDFESHSGKSGVPGVNRNDVHQERIFLPPVFEQTAIANALSDVDALLDSLEALIAKKQAIKTATMQQLLTGRTRLPQFALNTDGSKKGYKQSELGEIPEDWEVMDFDDVAARINTKKNQISTSDYQNYGSYPVVDQGKKKIVGYSDLECKVFKVSDAGVIVFGDHTCIVKYIGFSFLVGADGVQVISGREGCNTRFLSYVMSFFPVEPTGYNRHYGALKESIYSFPKQDEQAAIATILSDMDEELQALEQQLSKTRQLKQGMMQQLLTGKVRLVTPA